MESAKDSFTAMTKLFNDRMNEFQKEMQKTNPLAVSTTSLASDFETFKKIISAALDALRQQVEYMGKELDGLEMRRRRKMLLLHGVPESVDENTFSVAASVLTGKLKMSDITPISFSRCHRLGRINREKPRPVLIKFREVPLRDKVWYAKAKLKGTGITMSEFLTKTRYSLFMEARQRLGVRQCWTREGVINVQASDGSLHHLNCLADLESVPVAAASTNPVPSEVTQIDARKYKYRTTLTLPRHETIAIRQLLLQHYPMMANVFPVPARRRRSSSLFRRTVYRHNLWARPLPDFTGRFRDCSPTFYRYNDTQMHRLMPWLNRELVYLLNENEGHITYVMARILELLPQYHINSPEFRDAMQRYFGDRTEHFLHELYCFASTPYDMTGYDRNVQYTTDTRVSTIINEVLSSSESEASVDSDIVMITSSAPAEPPAGPSRVPAPARVPAPVYPQNYIPDPATSNNVIPIETISHSDTDDDSEVMVVGYIKPPQDRTPEIVDLLGSDSDVIVQDTQPEPSNSSEVAESRAAPLVRLSLKCHRARDSRPGSDSEDSSYTPPRPRRRRRARSATASASSRTSRTSRTSRASGNSPVSRASPDSCNSPVSRNSPISRNSPVSRNSPISRNSPVSRSSSTYHNSPTSQSSRTSPTSRTSHISQTSPRSRTSQTSPISRNSHTSRTSPSYSLSRAPHTSHTSRRNRNSPDSSTSSTSRSTGSGKTEWTKNLSLSSTSWSSSSSERCSTTSTSSSSTSDYSDSGDQKKKSSKRKSKRKSSPERSRKKIKRSTSRSHRKDNKTSQNNSDKLSKRKSHSGKGVKTSKRSNDSSKTPKLNEHSTQMSVDQATASTSGSEINKKHNSDRSHKACQPSHESKRLKSVVRVIKSKNADPVNDLKYSNENLLRNGVQNASTSRSLPRSEKSRYSSEESSRTPPRPLTHIESSDSEDNLPLNLTLQKITQ